MGISFTLNKGNKKWGFVLNMELRWEIAYEDIIEAIEDFDIRYCIGTGGYGSVYKAQLPSGKMVALKKLHRLEAENPNFDKSFKKTGENFNRNSTSKHC